jgi:hypothetical protein
MANNLALKFLTLFGPSVQVWNTRLKKLGTCSVDLLRKEKRKQVVCHTVVTLPFTLKSVLRQKKEELWKLKCFTM